MVDALRAHGMGQLLDVVPNHMGVMGGDNAWWLRRAGERAGVALRRVFRHRLAAARPEARAARCSCRCSATIRHGARARRAARSSFEAGDGRDSASAISTHRFPLDPRELSADPRRGARAGVARGTVPPPAHRSSSASSHAAALPARDERPPDVLARRRRDKAAQKRRLAALAARIARARATRSPERRRAAQRRRPATRRASTRCTRCSKRRLIGSRTGAWPPTRSTTGASSTSTSSRRCAWRATRCSRRRTGSCSCSREGTIDGLRIDHPDGLLRSGADISSAAAALSRTRRGLRRNGANAAASTWSSRRSSPRTSACRETGRCTARPATASPTCVNGLFVDTRAKARSTHLACLHRDEAHDFEQVSLSGRRADHATARCRRELDRARDCAARIAQRRPAHARLHAERAARGAGRDRRALSRLSYLRR